MFEITSDWLKRYTYIPHVGFYVLTKTQAAILEEPYPLKRGWLDRAIGKSITDDNRRRFEMRIKKNGKCVGYADAKPKTPKRTRLLTYENPAMSESGLRTGRLTRCPDCDALVRQPRQHMNGRLIHRNDDLSVHVCGIEPKKPREKWPVLRPPPA